jgi:hypothetical protein
LVELPGHRDPCSRPAGRDGRQPVQGPCPGAESISDRYAGQPYAPITIPKGASFKDLVALKGKPDIGDQINKKIIAPLANPNKLSVMPDFNDANKLGSGEEMVDRLTHLITIFENKALDFWKNRAEGDDILGDAYEYLMRHFATESGKSKGQFYTPAEVSRVIAQILGIRAAKTSPGTTVDDPTCGSGSLLLKIADEARTPVTLYGQEKDASTSGLARMSTILHDNPTALIAQGNTLADPRVPAPERVPDARRGRGRGQSAASASRVPVGRAQAEGGGGRGRERLAQGASRACVDRIEAKFDEQTGCGARATFGWRR